MNADLSTVYNGLNALGRVPWKINRKVLDAAQRCWDENIPLGDVRSLKSSADRFDSSYVRCAFPLTGVFRSDTIANGL
jgi:DNA-directed RNA polymerase